jgi:hypothetical protein
MSHFLTAPRASRAISCLALSWVVLPLAHADEHGFREREARAHEFREHEFHDSRFFDSRYKHDHYYPPHGYVFAALPPRFELVIHRGVHFYFADGVWYRPEGLSRFVVVAPPIGLVVPALPVYFTTVWVRGTPYYYANSVYYLRSPEGYVVVESPPATEVVTQPSFNEVVELPANQRLAEAPAEAPFVYPRLGQTEQQTAKDRYECHRWAVSQTGYDPTITSASVPADKHSD